MSWSCNKIGTAGKLADTIAEQFAKVAGGYSGAETTMKNQAGVIVAEACASLPPNTLMQIEACGSAGLENYGTMDTEGPKYREHYLRLEIKTLGKIDD